MRWRKQRRSTNVEDRRGRTPARRGLKLGGGAFFLLLLFFLFTGRDPSFLVDVLNQPGAATAPAPPADRTPENDERADFVSVVLADTEDTWSQLFAQAGSRYRPPQLVLFEQAVQSACGFNSAAVGPFYCPADSKVYIDLSFFDDLHRRFGAPGDFAQAYVIAHEIGHHVQNLLGISEQVHSQRVRMSQTQANALTVRMELQADCFAGVWGYHANRQQLLERGDIEEGLGAAAAIGDDRLQRQTRGYVSPESFTHGSSEQRVSWFKRGLQTGRVDVCNTFEGS